jgi:hypothetical protein
MGTSHSIVQKAKERQVTISVVDLDGLRKLGVLP